MSEYTLYNMDCLEGLDKIGPHSIDLVVADPPYRLGKDYGNQSDKMNERDFLEWTELWVDGIIPRMKPNGALYIFATWRHSPEIFSMIKKKMIMKNEIIWDRRVPSMGGSTRNFSSVHDNIGYFVKSKDYFFDLDAVRIPYDEKTKKARSRSVFAGKKWLEVGYNPKDVWSISRLHRQHRERLDHPTQKPLELVERMVRASCPEGGTVLDPFCGSGTTIEACLKNGRHCIAFELNAEYCVLAKKRMGNTGGEVPGV
ncbi:MAG: DNA methyltransferase [Roseovarius sp.]|nr:DNA methyltransferase [Roseovarius sp.]MCY4208917.1 DNA methyltransferase [Roseovarius sp.]MCY4290385.1 DNA methyltransferase [Roseovarius sp.]MCY4317421.1 DNA methyltransferase [Roseovarius sp.]